MIHNKTVAIITMFLSAFLLSSSVLAVPGIPHRFYGSVTYNGAPAPDGMTVSAKINNVEVASTTTSGGRYGYDPVFYVDNPNNDRSGKTISFFVNGIDTGQTAIFQSGASTKLDLSATGPSVTTTTTQQQGGGGPSGGGGPGGDISGIDISGIVTTTTTTTTTSTTTTTLPSCTEKWTCTDWSSCSNNLQTRTCTDENNCGTDLYKPFESQPCSSEASTGFDFFTSFAVLAANPSYIAIIILGIIAAALTIFRNKLFSGKILKKKK